MLHNAAGLAEAMQCSAEADIMAFPLALHALPSAVTLIAKHNSVCFPVYVKSFEEGWGRGLSRGEGKAWLLPAVTLTEAPVCRGLYTLTGRSRSRLPCRVQSRGDVVAMLANGWAGT